MEMHNGAGGVGQLQKPSRLEALKMSGLDSSFERLDTIPVSPALSC